MCCHPVDPSATYRDSHMRMSLSTILRKKIMARTCYRLHCPTCLLREKELEGCPDVIRTSHSPHRPVELLSTGQAGNVSPNRPVQPWAQAFCKVSGRRMAKMPEKQATPWIPMQREMATLPLDPAPLKLNHANLSLPNRGLPSRHKGYPNNRKQMSGRLTPSEHWVILLHLVPRHCKSMHLDNRFLADWPMHSRDCTSEGRGRAVDWRRLRQRRRRRRSRTGRATLHQRTIMKRRVCLPWMDREISATRWD